MPYRLQKTDSEFKVVNKETGKVHAKGTTKARAERQTNLLRGVEQGWKPTGKPARAADGVRTTREAMGMEPRTEAHTKAKPAKAQLGATVRSTRAAIGGGPSERGRRTPSQSFGRMPRAPARPRVTVGKAGRVSPQSLRRMAGVSTRRGEPLQPPTMTPGGDYRLPPPIPESAYAPYGAPGSWRPGIGRAPVRPPGLAKGGRITQASKGVPKATGARGGRTGSRK